LEENELELVFIARESDEEICQKVAFVDICDNGN